MNARRCRGDYISFINVKRTNRPRGQTVLPSRRPRRGYLSSSFLTPTSLPPFWCTMDVGGEVRPSLYSVQTRYVDARYRSCYGRAEAPAVETRLGMKLSSKSGFRGCSKITRPRGGSAQKYGACYSKDIDETQSTLWRTAVLVEIRWGRRGG